MVFETCSIRLSRIQDLVGVYCDTLYLGFPAYLDFGAKVALSKASSHDAELLVLPSLTLANHLTKQGSGDEMPC